MFHTPRGVCLHRKPPLFVPTETQCTTTTVLSGPAAKFGLGWREREKKAACMCVLDVGSVVC